MFEVRSVPGMRSMIRFAASLTSLAGKSFDFKILAGFGANRSNGVGDDDDTAKTLHEFRFVGELNR